MSGVWGESELSTAFRNPLRTKPENWEAERIALLNRMREKRLRAESEAEDRELIDRRFGGSSKP